MAEYELIESRTISGKGVLKIPADKKKNRAFILCADVVRPPKNSYGNFNYNPVRGKYGFLTFLRGGYVINSTSVDYKKQAYDGVNDSSGQTLIAIKCMYRGIMDMFDRLENALVLPPLTTEDLIKEYENLRLSWDECRLVCYADTVLQLRLFRIKYDVCVAEIDDDSAPPPPPPPRTPVDPGTPIDDLDPPYDDDTNDDGNTQPFPGDAFPDAPTPCVTIIRGSGLNSSTCGSLGNNGDYSFDGYGELVPVTVPPNGCAGLRLYLDGVDQGVGLTFYTDAIVLSRTGTCLPPSEGD